MESEIFAWHVVRAMGACAIFSGLVYAGNMETRAILIPVAVFQVLCVILFEEWVSDYFDCWASRELWDACLILPVVKYGGIMFSALYLFSFEPVVVSIRAFEAPEKKNMVLPVGAAVFSGVLITTRNSGTANAAVCVLFLIVLAQMTSFFSGPRPPRHMLRMGFKVALQGWMILVFVSCNPLLSFHTPTSEGWFLLALWWKLFAYTAYVSIMNAHEGRILRYSFTKKE